MMMVRCIWGTGYCSTGRYLTLTRTQGIYFNLTSPLYKQVRNGEFTSSSSLLSIPMLAGFVGSGKRH